MTIIKNLTSLWNSLTCLDFFFRFVLRQAHRTLPQKGIQNVKWSQYSYLSSPASRPYPEPFTSLNECVHLNTHIKEKPASHFTESAKVWSQSHTGSMVCISHDSVGVEHWELQPLSHICKQCFVLPPPGFLLPKILLNWRLWASCSIVFLLMLDIFSSWVTNLLTHIKPSSHFNLEHSVSIRYYFLKDFESIL